MSDRSADIPGLLSTERKWFEINKANSPVIAISFLAFIFYIWRWIRVEYGGAKLWGDVTCCWEPLGYAVTNGVPIYTTAVTVDNKPPLWHFVAVAGAWMGDVGFALLIVDGIAATVIVYLTSRFIDSILGSKQAATIGAVAALSILTQVAYMSNNKLPAAALLFAAVYVRKPSYSGVLAGASVWVSQYTGLAIVSIGLVWLVRTTDTKPFLVYVLSGTAITALLWGGIWLVWGMESVVGGIKAAFFVAEGYADQSGSALDKPEVYIGFVNSHLSLIYLQLVFAVGGISTVLSGVVQLDKPGRKELQILAVVTVSLLPMFLFRFYEHYISFYIIPLSALIAIFFTGILHEFGEAQDQA